MLYLLLINIVNIPLDDIKHLLSKAQEKWPAPLPTAPDDLFALKENNSSNEDIEEKSASMTGWVC